MSRFLYAALCLLLVAWAAYGQKYTVESKLPKYTVKNKVQAVDPTRLACPCGPNCACTPWAVGRGANNCGSYQCPANGGKNTVVASCDCLFGGCAGHAGGVCQCPAGVCPNCPVQMQALQVCQNGVCSVVSAPQQASTPRAREGWRPGKFLGWRK